MPEFTCLECDKHFAPAEHLEKLKQGQQDCDCGAWLSVPDCWFLCNQECQEYSNCLQISEIAS